MESNMMKLFMEVVDMVLIWMIFALDIVRQCGRCVLEQLHMWYTSNSPGNIDMNYQHVPGRSQRRPSRSQNSQQHSSSPSHDLPANHFPEDLALVTPSDRAQQAHAAREERLKNLRNLKDNYYRNHREEIARRNATLFERMAARAAAATAAKDARDWEQGIHWTNNWRGAPENPNHPFSDTAKEQAAAWERRIASHNEVEVGTRRFL